MQELLYPVDAKPPFDLTLLLAAQHLLAALGGIIAVPLVLGAVLKLPTERFAFDLRCRHDYSVPRYRPYRLAFTECDGNEPHLCRSCDCHRYYGGLCRCISIRLD